MIGDDDTTAQQRRKDKAATTTIPRILSQSSLRSPVAWVSVYPAQMSCWGSSCSRDTPFRIPES